MADDNLALPFRWEDLPRESVGEGGYRALASRKRFTIALAGGRIARLDSIYQYATYGGVVCGVPREALLDFLPPVCTIAALSCAEPCSDADAAGSALVVIWYQRHFGVPEDGALITQLALLPWSEKARDWHW